MVGIRSSPFLIPLINDSVTCLPDERNLGTEDRTEEAPRVRDERTVLENTVSWLLAIDVIRLNAAPMALDPIEIMLAPEDTAFDAELIFEETIDPSPEIAVVIWVRSDEKADLIVAALVDTVLPNVVMAELN